MKIYEFKYKLPYTRSDRAAESRKLEKPSLAKPLRKKTKPEVKTALEKTFKRRTNFR
jgi:hypothetical protein